MKTALLSLLTAARRIGLWFAIREQEAYIDGVTVVMEHIRCPLTLGNMEIARHRARGELARLRAEYLATFAPGQRRTWRTA